MGPSYTVIQNQNFFVMGFFGGEDEMDDASADMLEWDLKSDGLDTLTAAAEFSPVRARSNTLGSAIFNMQDDDFHEEEAAPPQPPVHVSRVILGTEEPARSSSKTSPKNENDDFDFPYHGNSQQQEDEVVIEEEVVVVESEADVAAAVVVARKPQDIVVVEEAERVVDAVPQVVVIQTTPPPTTPPKDDQQVKKRARISSAPWDDIRVYNYCWPQLKQEGWIAKPGGDGLSSSWTYLAPGVRKTSEGTLGTTVFKSERALIKHCNVHRAELIAEAEDFIFAEEEQKQAAAAVQLQKQAPPPQLPPVQTPKKPKTAKPPVVAQEKKGKLQFSEIWPKLQEEGWTVRAGTGLESWRYVLPNSPGKQRGVDYLCSEEQVVEHFLLHNTTEIKPDEPPRKLNFEAELWPHLQNNKGWRYTTGTGVIEYIFYLPNGKSKRHGGKLGVDFLHSQADVEEYCRQHPEHMQ